MFGSMVAWHSDKGTMGGKIASLKVSRIVFSLQDIAGFACYRSAPSDGRTKSPAEGEIKTNIEKMWTRVDENR